MTHDREEHDPTDPAAPPIVDLIVGNFRTSDAGPDRDDVVATYENFSDVAALFETWTWWPREITGMIGDRITLGRVKRHGEGQVEEFVLLTSSPARGHDLRDLFGYQNGTGQAIDVTRSELLTFAKWVLSTFGTFDDVLGIKRLVRAGTNEPEPDYDELERVHWRRSDSSEGDA